MEDVPGFIRFNLVKGPEREDHVLYASHTLWASEQDFEAWTKSEAFRKAHEGAGIAVIYILDTPTLKDSPSLKELRGQVALTDVWMVKSNFADSPALPGKR